MGRGRGLAILYNEKWNISDISLPDYTSFESIPLQINESIPTIIATVYRAPQANSVFLHELSEFLTSLCSLSPNVILLGDFNIHIDNAGRVSTRDFFFIMPRPLLLTTIY